jgi:hypothetical protein
MSISGERAAVQALPPVRCRGGLDVALARSPAARKGLFNWRHEPAGDFETVGKTPVAPRIWHTEGSGKRLMRITRSRRLIEDPNCTNPPVLMIVDRNEPEARLFGNLPAIVAHRLHLLKQHGNQADRGNGEGRGHSRARPLRGRLAGLSCVLFSVFPA